MQYEVIFVNSQLHQEKVVQFGACICWFLSVQWYVVKWKIAIICKSGIVLVNSEVFEVYLQQQADEITARMY